MTYNELYPNSLTEGSGIIAEISVLPGIPWLGAEESVSYERMFSILHGDKQVISKLESLTAPLRAKTVAEFYLEKWTKLWNAYKAEYNITDAYLVIEEGTENRKIDREENFTHNREIQDAGTSSESRNSTSTGSEDVDNAVYGFNSSSPSPASTSDTASSSTDTESVSRENAGTNTTTGTDKRINDDTETVTHSLNKHGNIGYTTPQKLISEEIALWGEPYFKVVFSDIARVLFYQVF